MKKILLTFFVLMGGVFLASPVFAFGELIKTAENPAVYYLDGNNVRHLFPTENIYYSWYDDFNGIETLDHNEITKYSLGDNVKVRAGKGIITFETDNNFYAVEPGGILRRFDDNQIIEDFYGPDWTRKIIKIKDGFYNDYIIGEDITKSYHTPNGSVYKLKDEYYYKKDGILWPFDSWQSVLDNGFKKDDLINGDRRFFTRQKKIVGLNNKVFNPAEEAGLDNSDCENKKLKVAIVLVAGEDFSSEDISKLNTIKTRLRDNFKWATRGLSNIDITFPIVILSGDKYLFAMDENNNRVVGSEAINIFYDNNPDIFDFIILYNNFVVNEEAVAKYITINNSIRGTGRNQLNISENFGSNGKLKGIANMGNLAKYDISSDKDLNQSVNYVIHELTHHWSGRAKFVDENGNISSALLTNDLGHWSPYVNFVSPLGGNGWVDNGDGSYTNSVILADDSSRKQYSDIDLYFMGLIPDIVVDPIQYLVPKREGEMSNVLEGKLQEVSIDQITDAMGNWSCKI